MIQRGAIAIIDGWFRICRTVQTFLAFSQVPWQAHSQTEEDDKFELRMDWYIDHWLHKHHIYIRI
jgi:hypothetical protein